MKWMVMPIRRCFDFSGRSRRLEYWMFVLFVFLATWLIAIGVGALAVVLDVVLDVDPQAGDDPDTFSKLMAAVLLLFWLAMLLPWLSVMIRRLHDSDRSGAWLLIWFLPFGGLVLLVFACVEGTRGPNSYGEDPQQETVVADVFV